MLTGSPVLLSTPRVTGMGQGGGTHPSEGDNIKCIFPSVDCIQELGLRTVWVAIQLQLAHSIPRQVGKRDLGGTKPVPSFYWGSREKMSERKERRHPVDEGRIMPLVAMLTSTGQLFRVEPHPHTPRLTSLGARGVGWGLP